MYHIDIKQGGHKWAKKNLITLEDSKGNYDKMECAACGIVGRRYNLASIEIDGRHSQDKVMKCPGAPTFIVPKTIEITYCGAFGKQFENLRPGTKHNVIMPPSGYKNDESGVWVMGVGQSVKVLNTEYKTAE